jgi:acyl-coenzyme A synthetase/AMP-(fatty) acid ligase
MGIWSSQAAPTIRSSCADYRIEPGEIEAILEQCPGVKQAVVVAREDREGDQRLTAYLIPDPAANVDGSDLKNALSAKLPDAMIPSAFVSLSLPCR